MRRTLLVFIALIAAQAHAATAYRVRFVSSSPQMQLAGARVTVDGQKLRIDIDRVPDAVRLYDYALSGDGGKTLVAVNDELQTWFPLDHSPLVVQSHSFAGMSMAPAPKKIQWSVKHGAASSAGQLSYALEDDLAGTVVRSNVRATAEVWPMEAKPAMKWPAAVPFVTRIAAVDEQIARSPELLAGLPAKIAVTITRQYEGGPPMSETTTMTIDDVQELPSVDAKQFVRPAGYREQPPVVGVPGS